MTFHSIDHLSSVVPCCSGEVNKQKGWGCVWKGEAAWEVLAQSFISSWITLPLLFISLRRVLKEIFSSLALLLSWFLHFSSEDGWTRACSQELDASITECTKRPDSRRLHSRFLHEGWAASWLKASEGLYFLATYLVFFHIFYYWNKIKSSEFLVFAKARWKSIFIMPHLCFWLNKQTKKPQYWLVHKRGIPSWIKNNS